MTKLPSEIPLQIARKSSGDVWKIDELLDTIKTEIEAQEVSDGVQSSLQQNKSPAGQHESPRLPAFSNQDKPGKHIQCVYCKEHHFSASCDRVKKPNDRKNILKRDAWELDIVVQGASRGRIVDGVMGVITNRFVKYLKHPISHHHLRISLNLNLRPLSMSQLNQTRPATLGQQQRLMEMRIRRQPRPKLGIKSCCKQLLHMPMEEVPPAQYLFVYFWTAVASVPMLQIQTKFSGRKNKLGFSYKLSPYKVI